MIKHKEKKCKGTTSDTKGLGCGKTTYHRVYGLCKSKCYPKWLMETEAGRIKLKKAELKATEPRMNLEKASKERKETRSLSHLLVNTRNAVHDFVKERDKGKPCISCGEPWHSGFQAGHYKKAELFSSLKFDVRNISGQCVGCNIRLEGNVQKYAVGLAKRMGRPFVDELNRLAELDHRNGNHKWDRQELNEIRKKYQLKLKELKNQKQ